MRLRQLDGLRGLAALVVVVHHSFLVAPPLADRYRGVTATSQSGWSWWMTQTPLHLLWDGTSAVFLFFILSGFVLSLPFLDDDPPAWTGYFPRRALRLYLPTFAAVAYSIAIYYLVRRVRTDGQSWWVQAHVFPLTVRNVVRDSVLLFGVNGLNTPLWSLQWEVLFSVLLPVYVVVIVRFRRFWAPILIALMLVSWLVPNLYAYYLPIFGIGVLIAVHRGSIIRVAAMLPRNSWVPALVLAFLSIIAEWYPFHVPGAHTLTLVGCALLVMLFVVSPEVAAVGELPVAQWLGTYSFSLYLVHEPIVVSVAMVTGSTNPLLSLALSLPLALLVAVGFHRLIERPSHHFARAVGRRVDRLAATRRAGRAGPGLPVPTPAKEFERSAE